MRRQGRHFRLQQRAKFEQVGGVLWPRLDQAAKRLRHRLAARHAHVGAVALAGIEVTEQFQLPQRVAQTGARDPQTGGQLTLGWQPHAGRQFAGAQPVLQLAHDLIGDLHLLHGSGSQGVLRREQNF